MISDQCSHNNKTTTTTIILLMILISIKNFDNDDNDKEKTYYTITLLKSYTPETLNWKLNSATFRLKLRIALFEFRAIE